MRAIDADELKENLKKWFPKFTLDGIETKTLFNQILHDIDNAPTIQQTIVTEFKGCDNCELERPKGEWNYIQADMCICPFCGAMPHKLYKNYCAKCGADMRRGNNKETTFDDYLKEQLKDPEFRKEWNILRDEDMQKGRKE